MPNNLFLSFFGLFKIKKNEMPIKMYNMVQTGPNKLLGGLNEGLFKVTYQRSIFEAV